MSEEPLIQPPEAALEPPFELDEAMTIAAAQRIIMHGDIAREAFHASEWEEIVNETMLVRDERDKAQHSDGLTGLYNRDGLANRMKPWLEKAESGDFGMLFIDLDRFKAELRDHIMNFLFEEVGGSPMIIPVINVVGSRSKITKKAPTASP